MLVWYPLATDTDVMRPHVRRVEADAEPEQQLSDMDAADEDSDETSDADASGDMPGSVTPVSTAQAPPPLAAPHASLRCVLCVAAVNLSSLTLQFWHAL